MSPAVAQAAQFQEAVRENVYLCLGIAGPSGGGKTLSGMKVAQGIVGRTRKFAVIDTETRRALHYAPSPGEKPDFESTFYFDHWELKAPFRPQAFVDAIRAAARAGYPATMVDSFSAEWEGEGGQLDWHEELLTERVKRAMAQRRDAREWELRDAYNRLAWVEPKMAHKAMVQQLLQMRTHLILCLRAEDKLEQVKDAQGKTQIVPMKTLSGFSGWIPICEKRLPFELTASFILTPDKPGVPQPIKLNAKHRPFFPTDRPISEECGRQLAEWAKGGVAPKAQERSGSPAGGEIGQAGARPAPGKSTDAAKGGTGTLPARTEAQETDRRGADLKAAPQGPDSVGDPRAQGTESAGSAASRQVTPSNEPSKAGDESAPGLFESPRPEPKTPAPPAKVAGIDADDESQALVKLIDAAKAQLARQPTEAQWATLCKAVAGTEVLDLADPAALTDLLDLVKQLVEKDAGAVARARGILKPVETEKAP